MRKSAEILALERKIKALERRIDELKERIDATDKEVNAMRGTFLEALAATPGARGSLPPPKT